MVYGMAKETSFNIPLNIISLSGLVSVAKADKAMTGSLLDGEVDS